MKCQCESNHCKHKDNPCESTALTTVKTVYGTFKMCLICASNWKGYGQSYIVRDK